jgi:replicative DNA helicase
MAKFSKNKEEVSDLAAERAVLAGVAQYGLEALLEVDFIDDQCFKDNINANIFTCLKQVAMSGAKIEFSAILSKANELGIHSILSKPEEIAFLRSLFNFPIHKENIIMYATKLAKIKLVGDMRKIIKACDEELLNCTGEEEINDLISKVEGPVLDLVFKTYRTDNNKPVIMGEELDDYIQHLIDNPSDYVGISTGFSEFDRAIGGGCRRAGVTLIGARPKTGKSLFADAVALHVAGKLGIPVLMLDTEMGKKDHYDRILANIADVKINDISTGKFSESIIQTEKVKAAAQQLKNIPYHYLSIAGESFESILSSMRKWIYQHVGFDENGKTKDCIIIYDYLKLMNSDSIADMQEYQALGFLITQLHNFCVKFDVPCLSFVQINRDGVTKESSDVASGSDRLVWLCTSFTIFKAKSAEEQAEDRENGVAKPFNRKLVPVVSRFGGCLEDGDYINVMLTGDVARLQEGPTRNELNNGITDGFEVEPDADLSNF